MGDRSLVLYQFSRDKVEQGDFTAFLELFGTGCLPEGPALAAMLGGFAFAIDGYDSDPREIYAIPAYSGGIRTGFRFYPDRVPAEVGQRSGVCRTGFREHPDSNPGSVGQSSGRIRTLFRGIRTALDHPGWGEFGGIG